MRICVPSARVIISVHKWVQHARTISGGTTVLAISYTHHHTTRPHDNLSLAMSRELNRGRRGRAHSPGFCRFVRHAPESSVVTFGRRNCVGQGWVRDRRKIRGIDVYRKAEDEGRA